MVFRKSIYLLFTFAIMIVLVACSGVEQNQSMSNEAVVASATPETNNNAEADADVVAGNKPVARVNLKFYREEELVNLSDAELEKLMKQ